MIFPPIVSSHKKVDERQKGDTVGRTKGSKVVVRRDYSDSIFGAHVDSSALDKVSPEIECHIECKVRAHAHDTPTLRLLESNVVFVVRSGGTTYHGRITQSQA